MLRPAFVPRGSVKPISVLILFVVATVLPARATSAQSGSSAPARTMTVTGGLGNAMGWLGGQAERYIANERLSVFGGVGYQPAIETGDASGVAFAGGVRAFTPGVTHRAFVEGSVSLIRVLAACFDQCERYYGPGIQGGYQFVSRRGWTAIASIGVGYAPGVPDGTSGTSVLSGFGFGYTWRRAYP